MNRLRIGTDCSGIEAPLQALINLKVPFSHEFSSEINPRCIQSIEANYNPKIIFTDMLNRRLKDVPDIDLYVCGFPCQPFSSVGKRQGVADSLGRGTIVYKCLELIRHKKPKYFVLENVRGLLSIHNGEFFAEIVNRLSKTHYVYWKLLNTKDYGIPQSRPRVFIVGIRKDEKDIFEWPVQRPMKELVKFVDKRDLGYDVCTDKTEAYLNFLSNDVVFVDTTLVRFKYNHVNANKICPCLLVSSSLWCMPLHRKANVREHLRLQGFPETFVQVVSDTQLKKQLGNSMSVCVLEAIFSNLLG